MKTPFVSNYYCFVYTHHSAVVSHGFARGLLSQKKFQTSPRIVTKIAAQGGYLIVTGASNQDRTDDPRFTRAVLYQLSYAGIKTR